MDERHRERVRGVEPIVQQTAELLRRRATSSEVILWEALRGRQCAGMKFRRQHAVGPFIVDFYCSSARLVVEIDGEIHDDLDVAEHNALRQEHLERYGLRVLRFTNLEITENLSHVLAQIAKTCL